MRPPPLVPAPGDALIHPEALALPGPAQNPDWPRSRHRRPWSWWHAGVAEPSQPLSAHSHAFQLWRALGAEQRGSRQVLLVLLALLRERPLPIGAGDRSPPPQEKPYLRSLAVSLSHHPAATGLKGLHMGLQSDIGSAWGARPWGGRKPLPPQPSLEEGASKTTQLGADHTGPGSRPSSHFLAEGSGLLQGPFPLREVGQWWSCRAREGMKAYGVDPGLRIAVWTASEQRDFGPGSGREEGRGGRAHSGLWGWWVLEEAWRLPPAAPTVP